ncbi:PSD1 and planctomycete cytochrome C domain-containing protein [Sabulilitoribacter arenilitoris]|uniref:PSD1 and planctomycete cytochrome C domain-containing protein n=1 Tax=Wocania arenilitoris TaxID=2044858 RepID=A0AAE3ENW0_9FLAO|nr:PSD1 and planctomycete cytochrome C domain-containing protein [Wocania arenilitoris]MCF7567842.1 PSD1 and planctomycete cytochrome C domain-containing protein [Wocania arenilitoris]
MAKGKKKNSGFVLVLYFLVPFAIVLFLKYSFSNSNNSYQAIGETNSGNQHSTDLAAKANNLPEKVDYIFDVKPILSDRCYLCHGPDEGTREAGLRLDTKEGAFKAIGKNLDRYAIVAGKPEESALVSKITNTDLQKVMPPPSSNLSLTEYEKQVLIKWIEQGAEWKTHWSFVPPIKPELPKIATQDWVSNSIDYFIAKRLEQKNLKPSEEASKEQLIRRVYFDLTGLPPSIEDIDAFLNDKDTNAYEKVVDKLLASSSYGERMASTWLDVSRYADTHGYQDDLERIMWPWRDWVISAFNRNIPYDKFIKWQLAGDLLPNPSPEQIVATAFNRNHKITQEGGVIDEEYRVEYVMDRANTTAKAILGITMECARCHDHKYDPISMKEFYGFYAFFNKVDEKGRIDYGELPEPNIKITKKEVEETLSFINLPDSIKEVKLMVMKDNAPDRKTYTLRRGQYDAPDQEVTLDTPEFILEYSDSLPKNRLGLAKWLFHKDNSLTARVAVNRMWQDIFGVGIVSTSEDFGNQGALPSHPELLDWLAVTFREEGWDMKKMYKRLVMSSTYKQTSKLSPQLLELDPDNVLLARYSRSKLTAEMVRDNALAVSGLLVDKIGGPSVKPYQPPGLWQETTGGGGGSTAKYIPDTGENLYRRSLYTFWKRTVPPPAMMTFDAPTRDFCEVKRQKTSTPLQALVMLNDPQLIEAAEHLAKNTLKEDNLSQDERIKLIFRKITSRFPTQEELDKFTQYVETVENDFESNPDIDKTEITSKTEYAYTLLSSLIFNLDEVIIKG